MRDSRTYPAYPSDLDVLSSFKALHLYLDKSSFKEEGKVCENIHYRLNPTSVRRLEADNYREFLELLTEYPKSLPISIHGHFINNRKDTVAIIISLRKSELDVTIESTDLHVISAFHEKAKELFQATNPLDSEQKPVSQMGLKKTVFLAHRFDSQGNEIAMRLKLFLTRLGFAVSEGLGYEARDIPDKVASKISSQDIFICLVTPGDASWILSEASTARALNKYLIVLCQQGLTFTMGIIGKDYEYIEFPQDNIEKIYTDLLYALPS